MKEIGILSRMALGILLATTLLACAGTSPQRSTATYVDDKVISTTIKTELAADPVTKATQIQVETYDGIVQLSGFVDSEESKQKAIEIARGVQGVKEVNETLIIR